MQTERNGCHNGLHRWSNPQETASTRQYCLDCGEPKQSTAVDWEQPMEPAAIKMPTRDDLLADARRGNWQVMPSGPTVEHNPFRKDVIITRPIRASQPELGWLISRMQPGEAPFIHGLRATHWQDDRLGNP